MICFLCLWSQTEPWRHEFDRLIFGGLNPVVPQWVESVNYFLTDKIFIRSNYDKVSHGMTYPTGLHIQTFDQLWLLLSYFSEFQSCCHIISAFTAHYFLSVGRLLFYYIYLLCIWFEFWVFFFFFVFFVFFLVCDRNGLSITHLATFRCNENKMGGVWGRCGMQNADEWCAAYFNPFEAIEIWRPALVLLWD